MLNPLDDSFECTHHMLGLLGHGGSCISLTVLSILGVVKTKSELFPKLFSILFLTPPDQITFLSTNRSKPQRLYLALIYNHNPNHIEHNKFFQNNFL